MRSGGDGRLLAQQTNFNKVQKLFASNYPDIPVPSQTVVARAAAALGIPGAAMNADYMHKYGRRLLTELVNIWNSQGSRWPADVKRPTVTRLSFMP